MYYKISFENKDIYNWELGVLWKNILLRIDYVLYLTNLNMQHMHYIEIYLSIYIMMLTMYKLPCWLRLLQMSVAQFLKYYLVNGISRWVFFDPLYSVRNCEVLEILPRFLANWLICHTCIDVGRKKEIHKLGTEDLITNDTATTWS